MYEPTHQKSYMKFSIAYELIAVALIPHSIKIDFEREKTLFKNKTRGEATTLCLYDCREKIAILNERYRASVYVHGLWMNVCVCAEHKISIQSDRSYDFDINAVKLVLIQFDSEISANRDILSNRKFCMELSHRPVRHLLLSCVHKNINKSVDA